MNSDTCSYCKKQVPRCFIVCDNDCSVMYCSDACADADIGHHRNPKQKSKIKKYIMSFFH